MKQYLNSEQTAKLIELGFAPKMRIKGVCTKYGTVNIEHEAYFGVGELIEMLPPIIDEYSSTVICGGGTWSVHYKRIFASRYDTSAKELIDALYKMIIKLKEEGVV